MIIDPANRFVLLHIPKCAGKALTKAFPADLQDPRFWHWKFDPASAQWLDMAHVPMAELLGMGFGPTLASHAVIAVIRDPYTRFASALREHMTQHGRDDAAAVLAELDPCRIAHDPRYVHFCPMHRFTHQGNKRMADFLVRQETLKEDLLALGRAAGFNQDFFDRVEAIPAQTRQDAAPDPAHASLVNHLYARDFQLFPYPMLPSGERAPDRFDDLVEEPWLDLGWSAALPARAYAQARTPARMREEIAELKGTVARQEAEIRKLGGRGPGGLVMRLGKRLFGKKRNR